MLCVSSQDHRDFSAIGTAAGVATAFAAPVGGLLFTIEEGCSFYSTGVMWKGFLSTSMGVLTLHFLVSSTPETRIALFYITPAFHCTWNRFHIESLPDM